MKTLHIIIIALVIVAAVISLILTAEYTDLFSKSNFHVIKTEKLSDFYQIRNISNPNGTGNDYGISVGDFDWSHDGKFVAFTSNAGAPVDYLWTISSDGKEIKPLKIPIEFNSIAYIHISPDNNSVYFVGQYNDKNVTYQDIFRYDLSNKTYSFITKDSHVHSFDFMPDGNMIYVESHSNSTRLEKNSSIFLIKYYNVLWLVTPDGQKIKPIYNGTEFFDEMAVNPGGNKIVFVSRDDPARPSDNGTDIVNFASSGPVRANIHSYLAIFDMATKKFTILTETVDDAYARPKWISDDNHILYEIMTHYCVQDKMVGEQSCPAGLLNLMNLSENSTQVLYGNKLEPYTAPLVGVTIDPNKRSIIFGNNFDYFNNDIDGKGIYQMIFDKPFYFKE